MSSTATTTSRHVRRPASEWQRLVDAQASSGLSQKRFCEREGIAYASFCHWRKRLGAGTASPAPAPSSVTGDFIEVTVPRAASLTRTSFWDVELDLGNGMTLRLRRE